MLRASALLICLLASGLCQAAASAATQAEVAHLIATVAQSPCQFNRNGSWHDAKAAAAHLKNKFDYLDKRNEIASAEAFIDNAATRSSMTGQPYEIRCEGAKPVKSAAWFAAELAKFRQTKGKL